MLQRRIVHTLCSLALVTIIALTVTSPSYASPQESPPPPSPTEQPQYRGNYEYAPQPSKSMPTTTAGGSCTVFVEDPVFHTSTVDGYASQGCSGNISQTITVCIEVQRSFLFVPYWAVMGCKSVTNTPTSTFTSTRTDRYGYDYGTHKYRVKAQGSVIWSDGTTGSSPWVYSLEPSFTY